MSFDDTGEEGEEKEHRETSQSSTSAGWQRGGTKTTNKKEQP